MRKTFNFYDCSNPSNWDNELLEYGYPHVYQSSAFAEHYPYLVYEYRYYPRYIYITDSDLLIGQCLIGVSRRKTVFWLFGPVIKDSHTDFYNDIVVQMIGYLKKQGILAVDMASTQIFYDRNVYTEGDNLYSYLCETCFVDLGNDIGDINTSFSSSVRKNVRKCYEAGVTVEITNDMSRIQLYLEMLSSFRKKCGFPLPPFHPNFTSMKLFSREHTSMDIAFASIDGLPIAAMGYAAFGKLVTEIAVAESDEYFRLKLPANDLIKVAAIEAFKDRGMRFYDITGGKKQTEDPKEQNINKFKRKFGKRMAEYQRIEQQYITADSFNNTLNIKLLKARKVLDRLSRIPSWGRRIIDKYNAEKLYRR